MAQTFLPDWKTPCELATEMPDVVANFLQLDKDLHRRFREESVSDFIVAALVDLQSQHVFALMPDEAKTGSDFDIVILEQKSRNAIQFRIQSKRLSRHDNDWEMSSYKKIAHLENTGSQAATLIRSSASEHIPTIPLYAFYNPKDVCAASGNAVAGLELAAGKDVGLLIKALVGAKPKRLPFKRIKYLRRLFFPLSTILCPPPSRSEGTNLIPLPSEARSAVELIVGRRKASFGGSAVAAELGLDPMSLGDLTARPAPEEVPRRLEKQPSAAEEEDLPTLSGKPRKQFPRLIEKALANRGDRKILKAKVARPRVIFLADNE